MDTKLNKNNSTSPIFVLGNPRSGTTLLRLLLNAHSEIFIPPECGFAVWLSNKYNNWEKKDTNGKKIDLFLNDLYATKKFETWNLPPDKLKKYISHKQPDSYSNLVSTIYFFYAVTHQIHKKIWGDKNNFYIQHVPDILSLYPNAKFIMIIRDGRDVASSYLKLSKKKMDSKYAPNLPTDINDISREWLSNNNKIISELNLIRESLVIKYEDLASSPISTLHTICDFLHVHFEKDMLNYYMEATDLEPSDFFQWKYKNKLPIDTASIKQFKNELTPKQISDFNSISEELLKKFNYI